ncbi:ferredoxin reductase [Streptomyces flavofungini]|uniref:ferredoxin reductase n=1 Tax=Streptomyces flavofungini TaxID=68200 RepID=UPI0025B0C13F|nr:2Fe-2S iron-sulfur cluster-binding protein [Streptomyces flavofungini]WJV47206.1 2Fe-2S iron-sulfur cluster-binding protein [Streptomyces flavofungini]
MVRSFRAPRCLPWASAMNRLTTPLTVDDYLGQLDPLWSARHPAGRVRSVRREGPGAATLTIRPGRGWSGHRAGQYLPIGVEIDGVHHWRTYSITSPPDDSDVSLTVKARPDGRVSPHLVHRTPPGTVLRLGPAQGEFTLPEPLPARVLFVTAGSGITPVMGLLRTLARRHRTAPDAVLLHSAPTPDECLFQGELGLMAAEFAWLKLRLTLTRSDGRLTPKRIAGACPDWRDRYAWVCGPDGLLDAAERQWAAAGLRERLRLERFRLMPAQPTGEGAVGGRVRFARSGVETDAAADTTLLAAGEAAGVPMPYGCRRGLCFGCLVPLVEGRVRDLRTGELRDMQNEMIQTCVNGAAGPLALDL